MTYTVVKELRSTAKYNKYIELKDLMFVLGYFCMAYFLNVYVYSKLQVLYYLFSIACALFLVMRNPSCPVRKNYQLIVIMLQKDRELYRPIMHHNNKKKKEIL